MGTQTGKVSLTLDDFEQRLMVRGLADFRNGLIQSDRPTEDVDDLLLKVIDAASVRNRRRNERDAR